MRRSGLLSIFLILLVSFLLASPVFADRTTENLMSFVIESFDNRRKPLTVLEIQKVVYGI